VSLSPHPSGKPATFPTKGKAHALVLNSATNPNIINFKEE